MALGLALTLTATSLGAGAAEPTATERETARTLLFSGREKRKNGQLKEALADFEKAHNIMKVPTTGLDLGRAQKDLGMFVEARATLLEQARSPEKAGEPAAFKRARKEAKQLADEIAPRLATLTLSVSPGAHVKIDDAELSSGSVGVPLKVNPGKHEIVASIQGGDEKKASVDLVEGEIKTVELRLAGAPPPETKEPKDTKGDTKDPKDNKDKGDKKPGGETHTNPLVYVGAATAGVGVIVGSVTGLMAFSVKSDVTGKCTQNKCPPATHAEIDRGETLGTVSTVAFIVGGVGAIMMVYGLLNPVQSSAAQSPTQGSGQRNASSMARRENGIRWSATPFGVSGVF